MWQWNYSVEFKLFLIKNNYWLEIVEGFRGTDDPVETIV